MRILLVDDDQNCRAAVSWFLKDQGHSVVECGNVQEALKVYESCDFPMILSDIKMPDMSGIELLKAVKKMPDSWRTDVVLFTAYADMQTTVEALREGAYDYLFKPVQAQDMANVVERVAEHQNLLRENMVLNQRFREEVNAATEETKQELLQVKKFVAESNASRIGVFSPALKEVLDLAMRYHQDRSIPVLIQGETGTGKEIIAKTIHFGDGSEDAKIPAGSFVDVNCAAIVPNLFESELFGYEPGAFTGGMTKGQKGKLDVAQGGTIFFDEIGDMPLDMQGKLLRVLQEKEYYRVGGIKKIKTDVRVICATNAQLEKRVAEGRFRSDLFYRLKIGHIYLPRLRDRKMEILPLATMFLQDFARRKGKMFTGISPEAGKIISDYPWPGNVRELKNAIELAVFLYDDKELLPMHLKGALNTDENAGAAAVNDSSPVLPFALPFPPQGYSIKYYYDDIIWAVLAAHNGNQTATAKYLGMSLRTLVYRLKEIKKRKESE